MSSKLNSGVSYAYLRGGTSRVKADMVLFAGNTVRCISERIGRFSKDTLYKSMLPLPLPIVSNHINTSRCKERVE